MSLDSDIKDVVLDDKREEGIQDEEVATLEDYPVSQEETDTLKAMVSAGLFYGRRKSKTHPKMKSFILTTRNGMEIFDLSEAKQQIEQATSFLKEIKDNGGSVLVIGTQPAAKEVIKSFAGNFDFPYVTNKWVGGLLTNFNVVRKRVERFTKLKADKEAGRLAKYNKKELSKINREISKMDFLFSGVEFMNSVPQAMFIINPKLHLTALNEAIRMGIPTAAILSSDNNPESVQYPIVANDNAEKSIRFILDAIQEGLK